MASGILLKVSTAELEAKAREITNAIHGIEQEFSNMESLVGASKGYWEGDAGDKNRKYFNEIRPDMKNVLKRLKEHPKELMTMAGIYEKTEGEVTGIAAALPTDVIE